MLLAAIAVGGMLVWSSNVLASPVLELSAGSDSVTVTDADLDGYVTYSGVLGDVSLAVAIGSSAPASGTYEWPYMHLTLSVFGGTDLVSFSLTDTFASLDEGVGGWFTDFGGAAPSDVSLEVLLNGTAIASYDTFGPTQGSSYMPDSGPYTIELSGTYQAVTGAFPTAGSVDINVGAVPEPATMLLFGTGLAGLAGIRRKKVTK